MVVSEKIDVSETYREVKIRFLVLLFSCYHFTYALSM